MGHGALGAIQDGVDLSGLVGRESVGPSHQGPAGFIVRRRALGQTGQRVLDRREVQMRHRVLGVRRRVCLGRISRQREPAVAHEPIVSSRFVPHLVGKRHHLVGVAPDRRLEGGEIPRQHAQVCCCGKYMVLFNRL